MTSLGKIVHSSDRVGAVRGRNGERVLALRAAHVGRGKNRGQGSWFHTTCFVPLPYAHIILYFHISVDINVL